MTHLGTKVDFFSDNSNEFQPLTVVIKNIIQDSVDALDLLQSAEVKSVRAIVLFVLHCTLSLSCAK